MQLRGSIPANILPLNDDFSIDEVSYRRHIDWLASQEGIGGITCNGHAAEVSALSRDERRRAAALAVETVNGRVPVISGIYAENYLQAIPYARDAQAEGASGLLIFPPNALVFGGKPEMAIRHFAEIADAVPLPLVLFMYPAYTRMQYELETLVRICEIPTVAAVKEWSLDIRVYERNLRAVRSLGRPISMLSSFSTNLLPSLALGADGILSGHGAVIADLQASLLAHAWAQDWPAAASVYERIQKLTAVVYRDPMVDMYTRMKEQLVMLGRIERAASRPPLLPIDDEERAALRQALIDADLLVPVAA
ncbi:MAG TPA: dihydrodipicolinate synthase family protein [Chloroflexota bacterium]|nr:dihydrodipicolinate synthase family protein [Chloroflexota bacterium]